MGAPVCRQKNLENILIKTLEKVTKPGLGALQHNHYNRHTQAGKNLCQRDEKIFIQIRSDRLISYIDDTTYTPVY